VAAAAFTGATWPLFTAAPFTPLFLSVYASARWGTPASGFVATTIGVVWALWLAPAEASQFSPIPTAIFAAIGLVATRLVSGRSEALEALYASEARAIRALEETTAAEAKLRQAQKMEAVGQLVSGVAHNFNNLLTITMGYADLLMDDATPQARPHLEEIRHATQRGAKLTRQLLALGRKRDLGLALVDVNTALHDMEALLLPVIREDITLVMLPAARPAVVLLDPQDFDQILLNLVLNARDALPRGGSITIEVATVTVAATDIPSTFTAEPGAFVRVAVQDNGTGMTPEVLTHLFEPFFTTKEVDKGTGLGLAFTYGVVRNAQGFVTVASVPDQGTTVAIHFPLANGTPASTTAPATMRPVESTRAGSILVVEDELPVRAVAVRVLTNAGFTVLDAATPAEAIAIFERRPDIALLLTDVVMPDMRGPDLARHLLATRPHLKVLLMSGYHQPTPGEPSEFVGIDKPFTSAQLIDAVRTALEGNPDVIRREAP
jgi:signal transduction histidine kinase/CheY-like chemotaxis protein